MDKSGLQRLIPIILILIIVVVAVAALVSLGRTLFSGGGGSTQQTEQVNAGKQALTSTLANRSIKMSVRGPIVADENFRSYSITLSNDARNMTTYKGYMKDQIDNDQLSNNLQAYDQLVHALDRAKLMEGKPLTGDANDTRGICAAGRLIEFEVLQGGNSIQKLWTTTCSGSPGSLKANLPQVSRLFQQQIPDFSKLVSKINLGS